ncbi:type I secretion system permease/ATPase [Blastochloris viridis]|uniref:Type I secretion system ATP-binding protein PrsD n=1 Tax=Blastochloris viridis TaxID=1079 RepID=A0A0N7IUW1_BLAVI|nr:type I secretion system permease/ATPase [Blastochloris viridis]ALK10462.1 Type I secretion system ATP-binding protein PrsD [Blastochloris viridis]CUU43124.1 Type I secretion system ATP-binding protein PrsD [Blastochloris viridis]
MQTSKTTTAQTLLQQSRYGVVFVLVTSFVINILVLASPLYMQQVFDRVVQTHHYATLAYLTLLTVFALGVLGALDALRGIGLARIGHWIDDSLRMAVMFTALHHARTDGRLNNQVIGDLSTLRAFAGGQQIVPFFDAIWVPLFLLLMFVMHPWLGAIGLLAAVALFGLAVWNDIGMRRRLQGLSEAHNELAAFSATALRSADVIHGMGMFDEVMGRYRRNAVKIAETSQAAADFGAKLGGLSKFLRITVQVAVLGIGAVLVIHSEITSGSMIAASIILGRALAPVEQSMASWRAFISASEAYNRLNDLIARADANLVAPTKLPEPQGIVTVENASFKFSGGDRPILRSVSLTVPAGSVLALVGPSASGKSTLCKMIVGSWLPSAGHVRLDGAQIQHIDRGQISEWVGYLPQAIELFNGSVQDNISRFKNADDEAIVEAAKLAGCHDLILRLPSGYASELGESGGNLSGGQKQRIALARAVFGKPRVVVLDEPNSNLDSEGEAALVGAIVALKNRGTTVILVSHRLSILSPVDVIAVMRDGALDMVGEREAVLQELTGRAARAGQQTPMPAAARGAGTPGSA